MWSYVEINDQILPGLGSMCNHKVVVYPLALLSKDVYSIITGQEINHKACGITQYRLPCAP